MLHKVDPLSGSWDLPTELVKIHRFLKMRQLFLKSLFRRLFSGSSFVPLLGFTSKMVKYEIHLAFDLVLF